MKHNEHLFRNILAVVMLLILSTMGGSVVEVRVLSYCIAGLMVIGSIIEFYHRRREKRLDDMVQEVANNLGDSGPLADANALCSAHDIELRLSRKEGCQKPWKAVYFSLYNNVVRMESVGYGKSLSRAIEQAGENFKKKIV